MPERKKPAQIQDQQVALTSYLAALLQEVPDYVEESEAAPETAPEVAPEVEAAPQALAAEPIAAVEAPVVEAEPATAPVVHESDLPAPAAAEVQPDAEPDQPMAAPGAPAWAQSRFQCLVFHVAGLSLAVPLTKLSGVVPWPENITPMPNRSDLFLGLTRYQGRNVKVVDTALMVLPEGRQPGSLAPPEERLKHLILLDEGRWGLACDSIGEVLTLDTDEVRWRSAQGKRPWLAGTVLKHLCALLDAEAFVELLLHGERTDSR